MFKKLLLFLVIFIGLYGKSYAALDSYIYGSITPTNMYVGCKGTICTTTGRYNFGILENTQKTNTEIGIAEWFGGVPSIIRKTTNNISFNNISTRANITELNGFNEVCIDGTITSVSVNNIIIKYCSSGILNNVSSTYWQSLFYCNESNETLSFNNNVPSCSSLSQQYISWNGSGITIEQKSIDTMSNNVSYLTFSTFELMKFMPYIATLTIAFFILAYILAFAKIKPKK